MGRAPENTLPLMLDSSAEGCIGAGPAPSDASAAVETGKGSLEPGARSAIAARGQIPLRFGAFSRKQPRDDAANSRSEAQQRFSHFAKARDPVHRASLAHSGGLDKKTGIRCRAGGKPAASRRNSVKHRPSRFPCLRRLDSPPQVDGTVVFLRGPSSRRQRHQCTKPSIRLLCPAFPQSCQPTLHMPRDSARLGP